MIKINELKDLLSKKNARWTVPEDMPPGSNIKTAVSKMPLGALATLPGTVTSRYPRIRRAATDGFFPWHPEKNRLQQSAATAASFPGSWDWRTVHGKNWIPGVKNQGNCGSCVAFAVAAALETHLHINNNNGNNKDISEAGLFFIPERQCNPRDPRYGWYVPAALDFLIDEGACYEDNYPYRDVNQNAELVDGSERSIKITGYDSSSKVIQMKRWLCEEGPLVSRFIVYDDFYLFWQGGAKGVYSHVTGNSYGGHAVTVIGYDDKESCWICKNSWGPVQGNDGCFCIGYGECGIDDRMYLIQDAYTVYIMDELHYDPDRLRIVDEGAKGWLLTDGLHRIKRLDNKEDAYNALRVARRHTRHGFVGRDNNRKNISDYVTEYWTGHSGLSYEPLTKVDCITYHPENVVAEDMDERGWRLKDDKTTLLMAHDMNDALAVLRIIERHTKMCFIGRNNRRTDKKAYVMTYWE